MPQQYALAAQLDERDRAPRALVANDQEIWVWSLETILAPNGFAVARATSAAQVVEQVEAGEPDVLIMHATLRDCSGVDLCRRLREEQLISACTPVFITTSGPCRRSDRLRVHRAGGWEYASLPLDAEELLAKLQVYVAGKQASDRKGSEGLIDPDSGLYNVRGILTRVRELGLAARRHTRSLGCVTVSYDARGTTVDRVGDTRAVGLTLSRRAPNVLRSVLRASDIIGRMAPNEFVILTPETEMPGLLQLADRLIEAFEAEVLVEGSTPSVRVGCYGVSDLASAKVEPMEMIVRATNALRVAQLPGAAPVQSFGSEPAREPQVPPIG